MKKSKRFLCMLIAAVMLLGAFPAHAASALPAATYKAASPTRLPDGTTGATVGMTGLAKIDFDRCGQPDYTNGKPYGACTRINLMAIRKRDNWLERPDQLNTYRAKEGNKTVCVEFDPSNACLDDLVGIKLPAGYLYDFYRFEQGNIYDVFMCQYDTRGDTDYFTIPCAPGDNPNNPKPRKAAAPARTSFNDVQPGSKYYDAVTTLAQNKVVYGIFDEDPNGNFSPDKLLTESELLQVCKRLGGVATEKYVWTRGEPTKAECKIFSFCDPANPGDHAECSCTHKGISVSEGLDGRWNSANRYHVMYDLYLAITRNNIALSPEQQALAEQRWSADQAAVTRMINDYLAQEYDGKIVGPVTIPGCDRPQGITRQQMADHWKTIMRNTWNGMFTDGATEAGLADGSYLYDSITRGQLCLVLYRFGLTSFGCCEQRYPFA